VQQQQQRQASKFGGSSNRSSDDSSINGGKKSDAPSRPNPVLEEYRRNNPETNPRVNQQRQQAPTNLGGDLAASSIFEDDRRTQRQVQQQEQDTASPEEAGSSKETARDPSRLAHVLDPDPNSRERWQRKKVIQLLRRGGRLTPTQFQKRTEREHIVRSHNMKTSIKKLGMLARQISGKTVEDALTQMRFSKKKVAGEVLKQLELVRDEAVVMRGMGLGGTEQERAEAARSSPKQIQLKSGARHTVTDPSEMYISQAWVGRGPFGQLPDYRARGKVHIMRTPFTSLSVVLKEEKTRVREWEEREEKRRKKEVVGRQAWTQLPDRPVQWLRPWYGW